MYLRELLILNSGALAEITLKPSFNSDGSPKPVVLVGSNGSGKTGLLSIVADALIEIAALNFPEVTPSLGISRHFFRILGGRSMRLGAQFEVAAAHFEHGSDHFYYRSKAGDVAPHELSGKLASFGSLANWPTDRSDKAAAGPTKIIGDMFNNGAYVFFPVDRFEHPFWINTDQMSRDPEADFSPIYGNKLAKSVVVRTTFPEIKSWILGLMADAAMVSNEVFNYASIEVAQAMVLAKMSQTQVALGGLHTILSEILRKPVRILRLQRGMGERRICVASGADVMVPTLENLSSGQTSLLSIFGTILRYGDFGATAQSPSQIQGIALIDEIDAHLHADLQHDILPLLMKIFPQVQFVVTSHSPLFPLGMRKAFGEDGFTLIEMPSGLTIDPERFREFEASYAYFRGTQTFEADIAAKLRQNQKPLILCEGKTDPRYLRAAAELLGMEDFLQKIDIDWVGQNTAKGSSGSGKDHLESALKFLKHNPNLLQRSIVLLYDCYTKKSPEDYEKLFVRSLPFNPANTKCQFGIENLLPLEALTDQFYKIEVVQRGPDEHTIRRLQKVQLCTYLSDVKRDPGDFENFRTPLVTLRQILIPHEPEQTASIVGAEELPTQAGEEP